MPNVYHWLEWAVAAVCGLVIYEAGTAIIVRDPNSWNIPSRPSYIYSSSPTGLPGSEYPKTSLYSAPSAGGGIVRVDEPSSDDPMTSTPSSRRSRALRGKVTLDVITRQPVVEPPGSYSSPWWTDFGRLLIGTKFFFLLTSALAALMASLYLLLAFIRTRQLPVKRMKDAQETFIDSLAAQVGLESVEGLRETVIFTNLFKKLQDATTTATEAKEKYSDLRLQISEKEKLSIDMEARIRERDQALASARSQSVRAESLQAESSDRDGRRIEALERRTLVAEDASAAAREQIAGLKAASNHYEEEITRLRSERDALKSNQTSLQTQLSQAQEVAASTPGDEGTRVQDLLTQLAELQAKNKEFLIQADVAAKDREYLQKSINEISAARVASTMRLQVSMGEVDALQNECQQLRQELDKARKEEQSLRRSSTNIATNLDHSETERKSIQSDFDKQNKALTLLQAQLLSVRKDLDVANEKSSKLQSEVTTANAKHTKLQAEANATNQQREVQQATQVQSLRAEIQAATRKAASFEGEKKAFLQEIKSVRAKIANSDEQLRAALEETKSVRAKNATSEEQLRTALDNIESLRAKNAASEEQARTALEDVWSLRGKHTSAEEKLRSELETSKAQLAESSKKGADERSELLKKLELSASRLGEAEKNTASLQQRENDMSKELVTLKSTLEAHVQSAASAKALFVERTSTLESELRQGQEDLVSVKQSESQLKEETKTLRSRIAVQASSTPTDRSKKPGLHGWLKESDVVEMRLKEENAGLQERNKGLVDQIFELKKELAATAKERDNLATIGTARHVEPTPGSDAMAGVIRSSASDDDQMDLHPGDLQDDQPLTIHQDDHREMPTVSQTTSVEHIMSDESANAAPRVSFPVEQASAAERSMTDAPKVEETEAQLPPTSTSHPPVAASPYESSFVTSMEDSTTEAALAPAQEMIDAPAEPRVPSLRSEGSADSGEITIQVAPPPPVASRRQASETGLGGSKYATEPPTETKLPSRSQPARKIAKAVSKRGKDSLSGSIHSSSGGQSEPRRQTPGEHKLPEWLTNAMENPSDEPDRELTLDERLAFVTRWGREKLQGGLPETLVQMREMERQLKNERPGTPAQTTERNTPINIAPSPPAARIPTGPRIDSRWATNLPPRPPPQPEAPRYVSDASQIPAGMARPTTGPRAVKDPAQQVIQYNRRIYFETKTRNERNGFIGQTPTPEGMEHLDKNNRA